MLHSFNMLEYFMSLDKLKLQLYCPLQNTVVSLTSYGWHLSSVHNHQRQPENWGNLVMWEREIEEHSELWYSMDWYAYPGKTATLTLTKSEMLVMYNLEEEHSKLWHSIRWHNWIKIPTLTSTKSEVNQGKLGMNNLKRNTLNFGIPSTDMLTLKKWQLWLHWTKNEVNRGKLVM